MLKKYHIRLALLISVALISSIFVSSAFAAGGGCSGSSCTGYDIGGGGTYVAGNAGSGNLAGYAAVRLDAFRPDPQLQECSNPSQSKFASLGIPANAAGPFYVHYRVAILRSDNSTVVAGVPGSAIWDANVDFNANTGQTRQSQNSTKAPTHADPWIGSKWQSPRTYCLPLTGGNNIRADLAAAKPVIETNLKSGRVAVGMKKVTMDVSVTKESKAGMISIGFELQDYLFLAYRKVIDKKGNPVLDENGKEQWKGFNIKDPKSPISIKEKKSESTSENDTVTYSLKIKKKGEYIFSAIAVFNGTVIINGQAVAGGNITTIGDDAQEIHAIDMKSINRRKSK